MFINQFLRVCDDIVETGCDELKLDLGIISHITEEKYLIVAVRSDTGIFQRNETFRLQDTYCREVIQTGNTVAISEVDGVLGLQLHPLYMPMALEAYIGAPIKYSGIWGTINFSSMRVRKRGFSSKEVLLVEGFANDVSKALSAYNI